MKSENINPELLSWYQSQDEVIFDVVPHSHLDYAWYRDRESSKMREVEAFVKTLLVQNFTLEQMITAKEFIEGAGERLKEELLGMIREGRMELIAMYSQPDHFLSPQELRFWNHQFGRKIAQKLGGNLTDFEYLPDTFGGDENTPMILAEAGLKAIITMRGDEDNFPLSWWESPDGTRILRILPQGGYANAGGLTEVHGVERDSVSAEEYFELRVERAMSVVLGHIERYGERYKHVGMPHGLIMNGNDFTKPEQDLPQVLEEVERRIREIIPNFKIQTNSLGSYVTRALSVAEGEDLPVFKGEMRSGKEHFILRNIDSARMYLKQKMHEIDTRIYDAGMLVSMLVLARNAELIKENDHATWQQVVAFYRAIEQIIPVGSHDTISGCGSDDAYQLPISLMTGSFNSANQAARNSMAALAKRIDTYGAWQHKEHSQTLVNTLQFDRTAVVEFPMQGDIEHDGGLRVIVTDEAGKETSYPAQMIQRPKTKFAVCAIPMRGMSSVQARLEPVEKSNFTEYEPEIRTFENENYSVEVLPNGTLRVTDRRTNSVMHGLIFEDVGDRGDEYTFCPVDGDEARTTLDSSASIKVVNDGDVFTELMISTQMEIPKSLDGEEGAEREVETRSPETVTIPINTKVRLYKDPAIDRIEFATTINNTARDHRLRVMFDTPNATDKVRAKEPYGMTERPAVPISGGEGWVEPLPVATSHNQGMLTAGDLALYNRGLSEYEALAGEDGMINRIALTLQRSVGYLSRGNLSTRPGWAGPGYATPDAQMVGEYTYEYAVSLSGQAPSGEVINAGRSYMHLGEHGFGGANINDLFRADSSIPIEQAALSPTEDGQAVIARFSNPNDEPATVNLQGIFRSAVRSDAFGEPHDGNIDMHEFELPARGMVTVRLS